MYCFTTRAAHRRPTRRSTSRTTALCPPVVADQVGELLAEPAGGDALEAVDQLGHGDLRREVHQQVDVVVLAVELHQLGFEVLADGPHDLFAARQVGVGEHLVPVLRHENQVGVHAETTVSASADVLHDSPINQLKYRAVMQLRYSFRLYPNAGQRAALARAFGCARVVYNDALRAAGRPPAARACRSRGPASCPSR